MEKDNIKCYSPSTSTPATRINIEPPEFKEDIEKEIKRIFKIKFSMILIIIKVCFAI